MDPVSIVGVAAAAIQFCTFTASVARVTWRAVASSKSLAAEARDLETVSNRFKSMADRLDEHLQMFEPQVEGRQISRMELLLHETCASCLLKARGLHSASSALVSKLNSGGQSQLLWNALKAELHHEEIRSLADALSKLQREVLSSTVSCLWDSAKRNENAIAAMSEQITALHDIVLDSRLTELRPPKPTSFARDVSNNEVADAQSVIERIDWDNKDFRGVWMGLKQDLETKRCAPRPMDSRENTSLVHQGLARDIISQLKFDQMDKRHDDISQPYDSTFDWIWDFEPAILKDAGLPKWSSFPRWLESPTATPYWTTGKPGSGKSTLMRFIEDHQRLRSHLSKWKPDLPLKVLNYYAWNPGSDAEKSIEGLVRTVLFQILVSEPHLLPLALPRRWAFSSCTWSLKYPSAWEIEDTKDLEKGLACLLESTVPSMKLMILVDGLDEFDVVPCRLINTLESISQHGNVKLCVASRPWNEFRDSFEPWEQLKIHNLTANDIDKYTYKRFEQSRAARGRPAEAEYLRNEIQKHAGGVFQWVSVVTNFALGMLSDGDSLHDISSTLSQLPEELSDLYTTIWRRLPPRRKEQAKEIFALRSATPSWQQLDYLTLWCVNERHSQDSILLKDIAKDTQTIRNIIVRLLSSRTLGLLELGGAGDVVFLHRTIPEWLEANNILGHCALQAHMTFLQGLCVVGGHIDPPHVDWGRRLPSLVAFHLAWIVSASAPDNLFDGAAQKIESWLKKLEENMDVLPTPLETLAVHSMRHFTCVQGRHCMLTISVTRLVDLIASCGFTPFVASHIKRNRGSISDNLFYFCLYSTEFSDPIVDHAWTPVRIRLDLLRLCLNQDVTPVRFNSKTFEVCSYTDIAKDFRLLAKKTTGNDMVLHSFCNQVIGIIEKHQTRSVYSKWKKKFSSVIGSKTGSVVN